MKLFSKKHVIISILTFFIIFLMNIIGNEAPDKWSSALLNAGAGVLGMSIGLFVLYKNKDKNPPD